jgi:hypothetical protein
LPAVTGLRRLFATEPCRLGLSALACPTCIPGWDCPQGSPVTTASRHQLFVFFESHRWCLYETGQASRLEEQAAEGLRKARGGRCRGNPTSGATPMLGPTRVPDSSGDAARGTQNLGRRGSAKPRPTPVGRAARAHPTQSGRSQARRSRARRTHPVSEVQPKGCSRWETTCRPPRTLAEHPRNTCLS